MLQPYPVVLTPAEGNTVIAEVPDVPGTITYGDDEASALNWVQDALVLTLSSYIENRQEIPEPSEPKREQPVVTLPPLVAAKLALYRAMRDQGVTQEALAERLRRDPQHVGRLLDLDHASRLDHLEAALRALGKTLVIDVRDAAA